MKTVAQFILEQMKLVEDHMPPTYDPDQPVNEPTEDHMHDFVNWHMENTDATIDDLRQAFAQKFPNHHDQFDRVVDKAAGEY